jgi:hypothetical protein
MRREEGKDAKTARRKETNCLGLSRPLSLHDPLRVSFAFFSSSRRILCKNGWTFGPTAKRVSDVPEELRTIA